MKVLLIVLGVLFLIGCIPVGVFFRYHDEIELKLTVFFIRIGILPKKPLSRKKPKRRKQRRPLKRPSKKRKRRKSNKRKA